MTYKDPHVEALYQAFAAGAKTGVKAVDCTIDADRQEENFRAAFQAQDIVPHTLEMDVISQEILAGEENLARMHREFEELRALRFESACETES